MKTCTIGLLKEAILRQSRILVCLSDTIKFFSKMQNYLIEIIKNYFSFQQIDFGNIYKNIFSSLFVDGLSELFIDSGCLNGL